MGAHSAKLIEAFQSEEEAQRKILERKRDDIIRGNQTTKDVFSMIKASLEEARSFLHDIGINISYRDDEYHCGELTAYISLDSSGNDRFSLLMTINGDNVIVRSPESPNGMMCSSVDSLMGMIGKELAIYTVYKNI